MPDRRLNKYYLAFFSAVAFSLVTLTLLSVARWARFYPAEALLFFSSPVLWLAVMLHAQFGVDPGWMRGRYFALIAPFFVYGFLHGLCLQGASTRKALVRALLRRYVLTLLVVTLVGLGVAAIVLTGS